MSRLLQEVYFHRNIIDLIWVRFISVEITVPKVRKTANVSPTNLRDVPLSTHLKRTHLIYMIASNSLGCMTDNGGG